MIGKLETREMGSREVSSLGGEGDSFVYSLIQGIEAIRDDLEKAGWQIREESDRWGVFRSLGRRRTKEDGTNWTALAYCDREHIFEVENAQGDGVRLTIARQGQLGEYPEETAEMLLEDFQGQGEAVEEKKAEESLERPIWTRERGEISKTGAIALGLTMALTGLAAIGWGQLVGSGWGKGQLMVNPGKISPSVTPTKVMPNFLPTRPPFQSPTPLRFPTDEPTPGRAVPVVYSEPQDITVNERKFGLGVDPETAEELIGFIQGDENVFQIFAQRLKRPDLLPKIKANSRLLRENLADMGFNIDQLNPSEVIFKKPFNRIDEDLLQSEHPKITKEILAEAGFFVGATDEEDHAWVRMEFVDPNNPNSKATFPVEIGNFAVPDLSRGKFPNTENYWTIIQSVNNKTLIALIRDDCVNPLEMVITIEEVATATPTETPFTRTPLGTLIPRLTETAIPPVPPAETVVPTQTLTETPVPPTSTATETPIPPTETLTLTPPPTQRPENTATLGPTATFIVTATFTSGPEKIPATPVSSPTPAERTPTPVTFPQLVPPTQRPQSTATIGPTATFIVTITPTRAPERTPTRVPSTPTPAPKTPTPAF